MYGKTIEIELIPNGKDVAVTNDNRQHFVDLYVDSILNKSVENQFEAFKKGFYQVCCSVTKYRNNKKFKIEKLLLNFRAGLISRIDLFRVY